MTIYSINDPYFHVSSSGIADIAEVAKIQIMKAKFQDHLITANEGIKALPGKKIRDQNLKIVTDTNTDIAIGT